MASQGPIDEPPLVAFVEMMVERMGGLEDQLRAHIRDSQRMLQAHLRDSEHRDDMSGPGIKHGFLDSESKRPYAVYKGYHGMAQGLVYVKSVPKEDMLFDIAWFDHKLHRPTLVAAWGAEVADRAIAYELRYNTKFDHHEYPNDPNYTFQYDGIDRRYEVVCDAKLDVVLRAEFPDAVERSTDYGLWLRIKEPTGLRDLLRLLRKMAAVTGSTPLDQMIHDGCQIEIYDTKSYSPEAISILMDCSYETVLDYVSHHLSERWASDRLRRDRDRIRRDVKIEGTIAHAVIGQRAVDVLDGADDQ
jgi:hypothetical protein